MSGFWFPGQANSNAGKGVAEADTIKEMATIAGGRKAQPRDILRLVLLDLPGPCLDSDSARLLEQFPVGGILFFRRNLPSSERAAALCQTLRNALAGPILAIDQEGGSVVRLLDPPLCPGAMALGAADDPALTEEVAAAMARRLRALGIDLNFAPVADVNVNPRNPVIGTRAFGSAPDLVSRHVAAFIRGHQREGVAACAKHFPGHGDTHLDSHVSLPTVAHSLERLHAVELPPFQAAIAAGCAAIMPGHLLVKELDRRPATVSRRILVQLLREELGFRGLVVTDALNMGGIARDYGHTAAAEAIGAGADLALVLGDVASQKRALEELLRRAESGRIPLARIAEALGRIRGFRERFPEPPSLSKLPDWSAEEALMLRAAKRSLVRVGDPFPISRGDSILLVARREESSAAKALQLGATDSESIAAEFFRLLQARFPRIRLLLYDRDHPLSALPRIQEAQAEADRVVWLWTSRLQPSKGEQTLARGLWGIRPFLQLALASPYARGEIPGPAIFTFGYRTPSLRALVKALENPETCSARMPVRLVPGNGLAGGNA